MKKDKLNTHVFSGRTLPATNPLKTGQVIRLLRRRAHLSQGKLAEMLGIRQGPLSNLERGKHLPSTPVLAKLAEIFDVSLESLLWPDMVSAPDAQTVVREPLTDLLLKTETDLIYGLVPERAFQFSQDCFATSPVAARPGETIARKVEAGVADILALEDICRVPRHARIPLRMSFLAAEDDMRRLAIQLRNIMGVSETVVFDYLELFENHGLRVFFMELSGVAHSLSYFDVRYGNVCIFIESEINPERQIFSLAYELGRILLFASRNDIPSLEEAKKSEDELNKLARVFASEFLMPANVVRNTVLQVGVHPGEWDYALLLRLKHRFGVSAEAFNYRLLELNLITPELQAEFRDIIKTHYATHIFAEPGSSRRILSPNGRLGDLLHLALARQDKESQEIACRLKQMNLLLD